jgi:nickel-dependent lactate racemase
MKFALPQRAWYGDLEIEVELPDSWEVKLNGFRGQNEEALSREELGAGFMKPISTDRIRSLAKDRREAVILFDDISRPTPAAKIVPYIIEEMRAGGIKDEQIRFVVANGAHRTHTLIDFEKKLGKEIVERFRIYNHNPYENCEYIGRTSSGSSILINSEVMSCDLKIGIGCVVPHITAGFGGSGKIILPGVAHIDTIEENHCRVGGRGRPEKEHIMGRLHPLVGLGKFENNPMALDQLEAAQMAGLDVKIDAIVNLRREITHLFVGEVSAVRETGIRVAKEFYLTEQEQEMDVVIANAYSKGNEADLAIPLGASSLKKEGGDLVVISDCPEGQICNYFCNSFGKNAAGRVWGPRPMPSCVNRLVVFSPYVDWAGAELFGPSDKVLWAKSWGEVMAILETDHGNGTKCVIYPDATIQYFGA